MTFFARQSFLLDHRQRIRYFSKNKCQNIRKFGKTKLGKEWSKYVRKKFKMHTFYHRFSCFFCSQILGIFKNKREHSR